MASCSEAAFWMFLYLYVCICMKMCMYVHTQCPYFKEVMSICSVWLFCEVVFFWTLLSDPCPQIFISFRFWKPVWMDHTGPCKAEVGEKVEAGVLKSSLLLRTFPTKFACKVNLWVCNTWNFRWIWRWKLGCVINAKDTLKRNADLHLCSN